MTDQSNQDSPLETFLASKGKFVRGLFYIGGIFGLCSIGSWILNPFGGGQSHGFAAAAGVLIYLMALGILAIGGLISLILLFGDRKKAVGHFWLVVGWLALFLLQASLISDVLSQSSLISDAGFFLLNVICLPVSLVLWGMKATLEFVSLIPLPAWLVLLPSLLVLAFVGRRWYRDLTGRQRG